MAKKKRKPRAPKVKRKKQTAASKKSEADLLKAKELLNEGIAIEGVATLTEAFNTGISAIAQADAIRAKGKFDESQLIQSAEAIERGAEDVVSRGRESSKQVLEKARQTKATQRAQLAATGVDIDFGSAQDLQAETIEFGIEDARTVTTNAYREAFGLKKQAVNRRQQAKVSRASRKFNERTTLVTGGLKAVSGATAGIAKLQQAGAFE